MGIVRFALRWPYTFYVLALLILFLGITIGQSRSPARDRRWLKSRRLA